MDLDALAGVIAYRHTGDSVTTVTAAVDRITIEHPLMEICDLELSGQVTYATGRSSMEVSLQVAKVPAQGQQPKPEDVLITCAFTMVSLDPATKTYGSFYPLEIPDFLLTRRLAPYPSHRCWSKMQRSVSSSSRARRTTKLRNPCGPRACSKRPPETRRVT